MVNQTPEQIVRERLGQTSFSRANLTFITPKQGYFSGKTFLETDEVEIGYNPSYETREKRNPRPVLISLSEHEVMHHPCPEIDGIGYQGCPGNVRTDFECFKKPMAEVLSSKGFTREDIHYATNALEDTLLHFGKRVVDSQHVPRKAQLSEYYKRKFENSTFQGIPEFFRLQAPFTDYYESHVALNMLLWGTADQKSQVNYLYQMSEEKTKALTNFMKRTEMFSRQGSLKPLEELANIFLDEQKWPEISRIYAEEFSTLMTPGYAQGLPDHNGSGTKGREDEDSKNQGNPFSRETDTGRFQDEVAYEYFKKGDELPAAVQVSEGERLQRLSGIMQRLAKKMVVKSETETQNQSFPIVHIGGEEYDPNKHSGNLKFRPGINTEGEVDLLVKPVQIDFQYPVKKSKKGFPNLTVAFADTSYSMREPVDKNGRGNTNIFPFGDNSRYFYEWLTAESLWQFCMKDRLVSERNISLANFSNQGQTKYTKGLRASRENLAHPQFGDTYIDPSIMKGIFSERDNLIVTLSDGQFHNWDEFGEYMLKGASRNQCIHFHLGSSENPVLPQMRDAGIYVVPVREIKLAPRLMIDLTKILTRK